MKYLVTGRFKYRGHAPGEEFEANLDPDVEERAVRKGTIRVLDRKRTRLEPERVSPAEELEESQGG